MYQPVEIVFHFPGDARLHRPRPVRHHDECPVIGDDLVQNGNGMVVGASAQFGGVEERDYVDFGPPAGVVKSL